MKKLNWKKNVIFTLHDLENADGYFQMEDLFIKFFVFMTILRIDR